MEDKWNAGLGWKSEDTLKCQLEECLDHFESEVWLLSYGNTYLKVVYQLPKMNGFKGKNFLAENFN